jgi:predicted dehydrogenase/threonine dehydrogenase-like Zn-dependent dehydrogenase
MRQVLQELGSGKTVLAEVPEPAASPGTLRILTRRSLISAGTERMLIEFGRAGWVDRARQHPERVQQVLNKVRTDGLAAAAEAVRSKLDQSLPLGYCNVGQVDVAQDLAGFVAGERVVSNGPHAEVVAVPANLCARIPAGVGDDEAAFAVVGAVGLQGVRLAAPSLGESFVVTGLGLIGLITVQLLRANGCRVLGIDPDPLRTALARGFGATTIDLGGGEDPVAVAAGFSGGRGVDGVLITAATQSDEPVSQSARMCRKRGRIVLVGVAGLRLNRAEFYEKELTFQVSCSYGPGRYDPEYEQGGRDYPFGFVRWTAQRNFEAVLELIAERRLDVLPLITHRFPLAEASRAYDLLTEKREPALGVLLEYPDRTVGAPAARTLRLAPAAAVVATEPAVAVLGAGNYAGRILIPALARSGARLLGIASHGGVTAARLGRKYGFSTVTTDPAGLLADPQVNAVVVATRHDTHATFVQQALEAGKHVFVEKPLAITAGEIDGIESTLAKLPGPHQPMLMVGFNRRFAPLSLRMKALLEQERAPKSFIVTVNAGAVPAGHWTQAAAVGGGRIIGECCHFIDLLRFLAGSPIVHWDLATVAATGSEADTPATITLTFADGSAGTVHYFSNGHATFPKERIEVFCAGRILQLDNFRALRGFGWGGLGPARAWRQDKGQNACAAAFIAAIRSGGGSPIPLEEILEVSRTTVAVGTAARRTGSNATCHR